MSDKLVMPLDAFVRAADYYCQKVGYKNPETIFKLAPEMEDLALRIAALKEAGLII